MSEGTKATTQPTGDFDPAEQELKDAQAKVAAAKAKLAQIEAARLAKAQADLAAEKARKERELFEQREEQRKREEYWRQKRNEEKEAAEAARRAAEEKERHLAEEADRLRREKDAREKLEKQARDAAQEAQMLEAEAKRLEAELYRTKPAAIPDEQFVERSRVAPGATANSDTQGRDRLFARCATEPTIQSQPVPETPIEYRFPAEYEIKAGRLDERVFALLFGPAHTYPFFLSPQNGDLVIAGYHWRLDGPITARTFFHGTKCHIEDDFGYFLVSHDGLVPVIPVAVDELFKPEPLSLQEVPSGE